MAAISLRDSGRAAAQRPGTSCSVMIRRPVRPFALVLNQPGRPEDHRAAVVHRVAEHRPGADDPVEMRDRDADLLAVGGQEAPVGAEPCRSSRSPSRPYAVGSTTGMASMITPRWQTRPASSTAYRSPRSVRPRSLCRCRAVFGVVDSGVSVLMMDYGIEKVDC